MTSSIHTRLIDFHSHYFDPVWYSSLPPQGPAVFKHAWPLLSNIEAQLATMEEAGIDEKVLSAPARSLVASGQSLPLALMKRINDRFAEMVAAHPERLLALATVDAFQGDAAASEAERAIRILKLGGICVDCASGDRYLDAPEAQPTLETAAALNVPVFVHPVSPEGLTGRLERLGHTGILMARGTETAASVLALLRSGIFDKLPHLRLVLPMIAASAFMFSGIADQEQGREGGWGNALPSEIRTHLYVDTMGFDAASIRFAIELLGPEHVLLGSDWPIMPIMTLQSIEELLTSLQLTEAQQGAILGGNTLRLLTPQS